MKILITGGGGFIGSNLAVELLQLGHNVIIIDNFINSRWSCTSALYDRLISMGNANTDSLTIVTCDLSNVHLSWKVEEYFADADVVYHLASSVGVRSIDVNPRAAFTNMLNINTNISYLLQRYNNRIIFASTSEVYGDNPNAREVDTLKISPPTQLRWGYACNKLMFEFIYNSLDVETTIARFFNVTGGNHMTSTGMVLPSFIDKAKKGDPLVIHGDGNQFRSFCDIRDAVKMLILLLEDVHVGEIYNIGNDKNRATITSLAEKVVELTNSKSEIIYISREEHFTSNSGEIFERSPNIDKIKQYYTPMFSIDDIILNMIASNDKI